MPIYEYECNACGKSFEIFLSMSDKPVKKCPHCKSSKIRKLVSNCSFQLKGSGWYVTDYARKDNSNSGKKKQKKSDAQETSTASETSDSKKSTESSTSKSTATNKAA